MLFGFFFQSKFCRAILTFRKYFILLLPNLDIIIVLHVFVGQQRSRMLATLFKDERCQQLPAFSILEKMYLDRIIKKTELEEFAAMLQAHQKATTADGKSLSESLYILKMKKIIPLEGENQAKYSTVILSLHFFMGKALA